MSKKKQSVVEADLRGTTTYRLLFSGYSTGGFLVLCWVYAYLGPRMYEKCPESWNIGSGRTPPYPLGLWVLLLGVPLFALIYWRAKVMEVLKIEQRPLSTGYYVFLAFLGMIGASVWNFGINIWFVVEGMVYGTVLGVIDAAKVHREDFSFLLRDDVSETVKLAKLQLMHDRWFRYLTTTIMVGLVVIVGIGAQAIVASPEPIRGENCFTVTVTLGYLLLGMGVGMIWRMLKHMNEIEARVLDL